ncbi:peroxisome membrane protein [Gorgonomyces haynaldii]|nr:peroxisome membrane protein [Gorgonomyces haynaldii]
MAYKDFVLENAQNIAQIESSLRTLSYILPGRFKDAEIVSESLYSSLRMVGSYHDSILSKEAQRQSPQTPGSLFNRYTRHMLKNSRYKLLSFVLWIVQSTEVVMEMLAAKAKRQQDCILLIETVKTLCRLGLFSISKNRLLLKSALIERDYDMSQLKAAHENLNQKWTSKRTGKEHFTVNTLLSEENGFDSCLKYLVSRAMVEHAPSPKDLLPPLTGWRKTAEYCFILRPLLYVLAIRRYGLKSYVPWTLSLSIETFCYLSHLNLETWELDPSLSELEKQEVQRRRYHFFYYLLRDPVFSQFSRGYIDSVASYCSSRTILSMFGNLLHDYAPLWEHYHFYTSAF